MTADTTRPRGVRPRPPVNTREVRDALVTQWRFLPAHVAARTPHPHLDAEDADQAGQLGLLRAADLFEAGKGVRFCTYAWHWIARAIQTADADAQAIHVPNWLRESRRDGDASRAATPARRAGHRAAAVRARRVGRFPEGAEADVPFRPEERDEGPSAQLSDDLRRALAALDPEARELVAWRYGEGLTLREVGERLGVTRERARQRLAKVIGGLRRAVGAGTATLADAGPS